DVGENDAQGAPSSVTCHTGKPSRSGLLVVLDGALYLTRALIGPMVDTNSIVGGVTPIELSSGAAPAARIRRLRPQVRSRPARDRSHGHEPAHRARRRRRPGGRQGT